MLTFCARVLTAGFEPSKNWAEVCHRWGDERLAIMGEQPHWYLWAIGVQPACADAGVHSTLMHCVIDQAVRLHLFQLLQLIPPVPSCVHIL